MSENQQRIPEMLAENEISTAEAYRLRSALETGRGTSEGAVKSQTTARMKSKYLRVHMVSGSDYEHGHQEDHVNVRVPMTLIRAGMKFTSLLPPEARDKVNGAPRERCIDFGMRSLEPEDMDELLESPSDLEVDVVSNDGDTVKVYVE